jgi:hypothetical protein
MDALRTLHTLCRELEAKRCREYEQAYYKIMTDFLNGMITTPEMTNERQAIRHEYRDVEHLVAL